LSNNQLQAYYFDRDDVALPGMHKYFKHASDEEREHAMKLLKYLNQRGGRIVLQDIKNPDLPTEMTAVEAMTKALELEKQVNEVRRGLRELFARLRLFVCFQSLLEIHGIAALHSDANMCDFLETEFLQEQVDAIKELGDHITNLERVGEGLGVYMFDKQLGEHDK
jgi:ferritin heavy chain